VARRKFPLRRLPVALQAAHINRLPNWSASLGVSSCVATGKVQPTLLSGTYSVRVSYHLGKNPMVKILNPPLERRDGERVPHVYSDHEPCIYHPRYQEWRPADLIADTIIPWISEWLESYEAWLVTGEWLGGGDHPVKKTGAAN